MNNRIVIVPEDGTIIVDDVVITEIDQQYLSWMPEDILAFHWYAEFNTGEIEYKSHPLSVKKHNERVTELGIFEQAITTLEEELERRSQAEVERIAAEEAARDYWGELRSIRDYMLLTCDWTQLPNAQLTEQQKQDWENYRQELRNLPETITDPKPLILDQTHPSWPVSPN
jgi:hypothetical protein